jgi:hypothetical protein
LEAISAIFFAEGNKRHHDKEVDVSPCDGRDAGMQIPFSKLPTRFPLDVVSIGTNKARFLERYERRFLYKPVNVTPIIR